MARHRRVAGAALTRGLAALAVFLHAAPAAPLTCNPADRPMVWPAPGTTIGLEPRLLLWGAGDAAMRVDAVADRSLRLADDQGGEVRLRVLERHAVGGACARQVLLAPELPLEAGRTYELRKEDGRPYTVAGERSDDVAARWTARALALPEAGWTVEVAARRVDDWGSSVTLAVEGLTHQGTELLRIVLVPDGRPGVQEALVPLDFGRASVVSGGCSGAFDLDPGVAHAAVVQLVVPGGRSGGTRFLDLGKLREVADDELGAESETIVIP